MSVYQPLQRYLESRAEPAITLTYEEIEKVLGRPLPDTARRDKMRQWWANTESHSQALAWLKARRKAKLDVKRLAVTFTRQDQPLISGKSQTLEIALSELDPSARRILEDIVEETGGDMSGALVSVMNRAGRARRKQTLDWFAANSGPSSSTSSVDLIREDRDAR